MFVAFRNDTNAEKLEQRRSKHIVASREGRGTDVGLDVGAIYEGGVDGVGEVGGRKDHDVRVCLEGVQLRQEGVDGTDRVRGLTATDRQRIE